MAINLDVNRTLENKKTSLFSKIILACATIAFVSLIIFLSINGKHNKAPGFEMNIPDVKKEEPKTTKDSNVKANQNIYIEKNNGDIISSGRDVIKVQNNNYNNKPTVIESSKQKNTVKKNKEEELIKDRDSKNKIINNAPNNGIQYNGDNGTINVNKERVVSLTDLDKKTLLFIAKNPKLVNYKITIESVQGDFVSNEYRKLVNDYIESNGRQVVGFVTSQFNENPNSSYIDTISFKNELRIVCGTKFLFDKK